MGTEDHDDIEWEIAFYEGVVARSPDLTDALKPLGDLYTRAGHYQKGLEVDLKLARLLPDEALVHYNLACSHSLLKNLDEGIAALRRAVELGYHEIRWMRKDADLANLREDPRYAEIERLAERRGKA
jgi:tetratricopeptide (TPR) repeat protein